MHSSLYTELKSIILGMKNVYNNCTHCLSSYNTFIMKHTKLIDLL